MHRIDTATRATDLFGAGKDGWRDGNKGTGTQATDCTAAFFNDLQENLAQLIEDAGFALAKGDYTQVKNAIKSIFQRSASISAAASGTVDAITANYTPAVTALTDHLLLIVRAGGANTSATPTFTPASATIPAKTIVKGHNQPLVAGDISGAGFRAELQFDTTLDKWVLLNPGKGIVSTAGNYLLGGQLNSPTALAATDAGKLFQVTSDYAITLPSPSGMQLSGGRFALFSNASDWTLQGAANLTIGSTSGASAARIRKGAFVHISTTDGANWFVDGTGAIPFLARSYVRLNTANGYGSTNTMIRRFSNVLSNVGPDITYADSATLGASFTINADGMYAITYVENYSNSNNRVGISLNTTQPTVGIDSINAADRLAAKEAYIANYSNAVSWTGFLAAGSVIRPHNEGQPVGATPPSFTISRVN